MTDTELLLSRGPTVILQRWRTRARDGSNVHWHGIAEAAAQLSRQSLERREHDDALAWARVAVEVHEALGAIEFGGSFVESAMHVRAHIIVECGVDERDDLRSLAPMLAALNAVLEGSPDEAVAAADALRDRLVDGADHESLRDGMLRSRRVKNRLAPFEHLAGSVELPPLVVRWLAVRHRLI